MEKSQPLTTGLKNCGATALNFFTTFYYLHCRLTVFLQVIPQILKPAKRYLQLQKNDRNK